jgi:hypothetical protein
MKIENIRDLEKIIRVCRKTGVDIIKIGDIEIVLDKSFKTALRQSKALKTDIKGIELPGGIDESTKIEIPDIATPDELSDEQLMFYSAGAQQ